MEQRSIEQARSPEEEKVRALGVGVWKLSNDGNESYLVEFLSKYGIQEGPIELSRPNEQKLYALIDFDLRRIEHYLSYDQAIAHWKLLKDCGALTPEKLGSYIARYIKINMSLGTEEAKILNQKWGSNVPSYSPEFLVEFKNDLKERIREGLGWEVNID